MQKNEDIAVREAVVEDCVRLMELIRQLADYEKAPHEVTVTMGEFADSGFGPNAVWKGFVAEKQGTVIGFALWYVRYSTWKGRMLYLEDLYVEPGYRGGGVGALLMEKLIAKCKEEGYSSMTWQVLDWNEPAIAFYRKYGARLDGKWINCTLDI